MFLPNFIYTLYQHVWWGNESLGMEFLSQMFEFSLLTSLFMLSKLLVLSVFSMLVLCNKTLYLCLLLQSDWITVILSESNRSPSFLNLDKFRQTFVFMSSFTIILSPIHHLKHHFIKSHNDTLSSCQSQKFSWQSYKLFHGCFLLPTFSPKVFNVN